MLLGHNASAGKCSLACHYPEAHLWANPALSLRAWWKGCVAHLLQAGPSACVAAGSSRHRASSKRCYVWLWTERLSASASCDRRTMPREVGWAHAPPVLYHREPGQHSTFSSLAKPQEAYQLHSTWLVLAPRLIRGGSRARRCCNQGPAEACTLPRADLVASTDPRRPATSVR